jgi:acetyl esterase
MPAALGWPSSESIILDYSLSPEAKFPQAIDELLSVVAWLREDGAALGLDTGRVAIGGDSAGANLSVATNLRLREAGQPGLAGMLLNYGVFDHAPTPSYERYDGPRYMLTVEEMERFWQNYLRCEAERPLPLASPLRADLSGLPPAFMAIAQCDILADANREMAKKLEAAGVPVEAVVYEGATHSFLEAVSIAPLADRGLADASAWLQGVLKPKDG